MNGENKLGQETKYWRDLSIQKEFCKMFKFFVFVGSYFNIQKEYTLGTFDESEIKEKYI